MRRAFHFRLERIQRVRALLEQEARAAVQLAQIELARLDAALAQQDAALAEARGHERQHLEPGRFSAAAALAHQTARQALLAQRSRLANERQIAFEASERARLRHQTTLTDLRALERLSEREASEHAQALALADQAALDEQAQLRRRA